MMPIARGVQQPLFAARSSLEVAQGPHLALAKIWLIASPVWTIQLVSFVQQPIHNLAFLCLQVAMGQLTTALILAIAMCLETAELAETTQAVFGATVALLAVLQQELMQPAMKPLLAVSGAAPNTMIARLATANRAAAGAPKT